VWATYGRRAGASIPNRTPRREARPATTSCRPCLQVSLLLPKRKTLGLAHAKSRSGQLAQTPLRSCVAFDSAVRAGLVGITGKTRLIFGGGDLPASAPHAPERRLSPPGRSHRKGGAPPKSGSAGPAGVVSAADAVPAAPWLCALGSTGPTANLAPESRCRRPSRADVPRERRRIGCGIGKTADCQISPEADDLPAKYPGYKAVQ
jgi:hypothetical protein